MGQLIVELDGTSTETVEDPTGVHPRFSGKCRKLNDPTRAEPGVAACGVEFSELSDACCRGTMSWCGATCCVIDTTDPDGFEAHLKRAHGVYETEWRGSGEYPSNARPVKPPTIGRDFKVPRPGKGVFEPKSGEPGARLTYTHTLPGYWTGDRWGDGEWVPDMTFERTGTVWSHGSFPRARWVQPDGDEHDLVCVTLPSPKEAKRGRGPTAQGWGPESAWRTNVARIDNIRRAGGLTTMSFVEQSRRDSHYARRCRVETHHVDPGCPDADGCEPLRTVSVGEAISMVLDPQPHGLCRRCVYLDPHTGEVSEAVVGA